MYGARKLKRSQNGNRESEMIKWTEKKQQQKFCSPQQEEAFKTQGHGSGSSFVEGPAASCRSVSAALGSD